MARLRPIVCFLLASAHAFAATFYISPVGDDAHEGASPDRAWRTLEQIKSAPLAPGDTVLLERGGVWRETLVPPIDELTFGAYGEGPMPVISGATAIHRFAATDGLAYRAPLDQHPVQLHLDGVRAERIAPGTAPGPQQWSWDSAARELVVGRAAPAANRVEATVRDIGVDLNGRSGIILQGLRVEYAGLSGIRADSADRFTIEDSEIIGCYINCYSRGIYLEKTDDHDVFDNVVIGCAQVRFTGAIEAQSNPYGYDVNKDEADDKAPRQVSGNRIFHNTTWGGWWTFSVNCSSANCSISNTEVRDNFFIGMRPGKAGLYLNGGGANDGLHGDGNRYINNCFGARGQWVWGGTVYRNVADLQAASDGAIRGTVAGRPEFTDPENGDFRLAPDSIGRGVATDGGDLGARGL